MPRRIIPKPDVLPFHADVGGGVAEVVPLPICRRHPTKYDHEESEPGRYSIWIDQYVASAVPLVGAVWSPLNFWHDFIFMVARFEQLSTIEFFVRDGGRNSEGRKSVIYPQHHDWPTQVFEKPFVGEQPEHRRWSERLSFFAKVHRAWLRTPKGRRSGCVLVLRVGGRPSSFHFRYVESQNKVELVNRYARSMLNCINKLEELKRRVEIEFRVGDVETPLDANSTFEFQSWGSASSDQARQFYRELRASVRR